MSQRPGNIGRKHEVLVKRGLNLGKKGQYSKKEKCIGQVF